MFLREPGEFKRSRMLTLALKFGVKMTERQAADMLLLGSL